MKIPRSGPIWFLIVGIPALALCLLGMLATLLGAYWLDDLCQRWVEQITGGAHGVTRPTTKQNK